MQKYLQLQAKTIATAGKNTPNFKQKYEPLQRKIRAIAGKNMRHCSYGEKLHRIDKTRHCASAKTAHRAFFLIIFSIHDVL